MSAWLAIGGVRDEHHRPSGAHVTRRSRGSQGRGRPLGTAIGRRRRDAGRQFGRERQQRFVWMDDLRPAAPYDGCLRLLADVVLEPTLSPATTIDTERTLALVELANLHDDMYRFPFRLATETAYGDHPYGLHTIGSDRSLPMLTADDVRSWHAQRCCTHRSPSASSPMAIDDALVATVGRMPGRVHFRPPPLSRRRTGPDVDETAARPRDKSQTAIAVAFPGPARRDEDRFVTQLIAGVSSGLGGRFFEELRDRRSLAYTVQAFAVERANAGMFVGYIATSPDKEETARADCCGSSRSWRRWGDAGRAPARTGVCDRDARDRPAERGRHARQRCSTHGSSAGPRGARPLRARDPARHDRRCRASGGALFRPCAGCGGIVRGRGAAAINPSVPAVPAPPA